MNTITALDFNFARIDLQNGLALSHRNRIRIEAYSSNGAKAVAEGSYGNRYQLTVDLRQWDEGFVGGRCDCPRFADGWNCKHLYALFQIM